MKKLILGTGAVLAVAAVGWGVVWHLGKARINERLDEQIARQDAAGFSLTIDRREIGGFPFRYDVVLGNVALVHRDSGLLLRLADVSAETAVIDDGPVIMRPNPELVVTQPVTAAMRLRDPSLPATLTWTLATEDLVVEVPRSGALDRLAGSAKQIRLVLDQADYHAKVGLEMQPGNFTFDLAAAEPRMELSAGTLTARMQADQPGSAPVDLVMDLSGLALDVAISGAEGAFLASILRDGGESTTTFTYSLESMAITADLDESANDGFKGRLATSSAAASGTIASLPGAISMEATASEAVWEVSPADPETAKLGAITAAEARLSQLWPRAPSDTPKPATFNLELQQVTGDEIFWGTFDPLDALDRHPMEITLALNLMTEVNESATSESGISYTPTNVSFSDARIYALGTRIEASGDLDILGGLLLPLGDVALKATGIVGTLDELQAANILPPNLRQMADAMLQVYARPTGEPDSWESELSFGNEGLSVNGIPVQ